MFDNKCSTMAKELGASSAPRSIEIKINQFQKEPHHCRFENCQNHRRGYNDFCREHKAIGKIISGRIAREKAIAKIAARDKTNYATEVNPSLPTPMKPHQGEGSIFDEAITQIIIIPVVFFLLYYFLFFMPLSEFLDEIILMR